MKRILCMLLCLCTVLASVSLLASCKKNDGVVEPEASKKIVSVNLSDYAVVYDSEMTAAAKTQATNLAKKLRDLTGSSVRAVQDEELEPVATEDLEILIGNTKRKETVKALKEAGDCGWVIRVYDNKIVIVGTSSFLTRAALSYFETNYLNKDSIKGTTLSINKKVSLAKLATSNFVNEAGEGQYVLVYDDLVDDKDEGGREAHSYAGDNNPTGGTSIDYIYSLVTEIRDRLVKDTKAKRSTFLTKLASSEVENEYEILVGNMARDDVKAELNKLNVNQYGVVIRGNKIMLLAWNDVTLASAYQLFEDLLAGSLIEDEAGNVKYAIPSNCSVIETLASGAWMIDFPKPEAEGLYLHGTRDVGDSSIEYVYAGTGVTEANYNAYCDTLKSAGYKVLLENLRPYGTQNCFRQYTNEESGISLYVCYTPYEYSEEQKITDTLASIRIVATPMEGTLTHLPDASILSAAEYNNASYTKVTESMITSVQHEYEVGSWGLSYIITLEDGTYMLFDGGAGIGSTDNHTNLWRLLNQLHARVWGDKAATTKIRIRAWMLTHEHMDHFTVFKNFQNTYGGQYQLDYFLFNATSKSENVNCDNPEAVIRNNMADLQKKGGFKYIKAHTGQTFYFANVKMEIMATHEDTYPKMLEYFNNSTTIFKTTMKSTDAQGNTRESDCIWLGDEERIGGRRLRGLWGENLKAEMVQVAHHGGNGTDEFVYRLIDPKIVWFPNNNRYTASANDQNHKTWCRHVSWVICYDIKNVDVIVMQETCDYTMIFTTAGPDYENIFDLKTGNKQTFNQTTLIDKRGD